MKKLLLLGVFAAITGGLSAQSLYVGTASGSLYLGNGASMVAQGNVTAESNIGGTGTGRLIIHGGTNQVLDFNNKSVYGLGINKTGSAKAVLTDSVSVGTLELISGKLLLYSNSTNGYTLNITSDIKNATAASRVLVGSRNSSIRMSAGSTTYDTLLLSTDTLNHSNYLKNFFVESYVRMADTINIARLAYVKGTNALDAGNPGSAQEAYLKLPVSSSTSYGQLQFESGATLTGKANMNQIVSVDNTWIHWGSPFATSANTTYANSIADDVTLRLAPLNRANIFYYDESYKTGGSFWHVIGSTADQIPRGRGHAMYSWPSNNNDGLLPTTPTYVLDITGTITGSAFSGTYTANQGTGMQNSDSTAWQIIANPYYCNIDLSAIDASDISAIQGNTIYFYQTITDTANYHNPPKNYNFVLNSSTNGASPYVRPFQALYFRLADTTQSSVNITIPAKVQGSGNTASPMWKTREYTDLINITVSKANTPEMNDAAAVYFSETADNNFDKQDALKYIGDYDLEVYTKPGYTSTSRLTYNALKSIDNSMVSVPLGVKAKTDGNYVFDITFTEQEKAEYVVLEDKVLKTFTDVTLGGSYNFNYLKAEGEDRFVLHFKKANSTSSIDDELKQNNPFTVSANENGIQVHFPAQRNDEVSIQVFNLLGQQMTEEITGNAANGNINIQNAGWASGYYLVKVKTSTENKTEKVFIR